MNPGGVERERNFDFNPRLPISDPTTIAEGVERLLESEGFQRRNEHTQQAYSSDLRKLEDLFGEIPISRLQYGDLAQEFVEELENRGRRSATIRRSLSAIRALLELQGETSPKFEKYKRSYGLMTKQSLQFDPLDSRQVSGLLAVASDNSRDLAMITFVLATGAHISEVINIRSDDVKPKDSSVEVSYGLGENFRTIFLDSEVAVRALSQYKEEINPDGPFFLGYSHNRKPVSNLTRQGAWLALHKYGLEEAVRRPDLNFQALRYTFVLGFPSDNRNVLANLLRVEPFRATLYLRHRDQFLKRSPRFPIN